MHMSDANADSDVDSNEDTNADEEGKVIEGGDLGEDE